MSEPTPYARVHEGGRLICGISPNGRYIISCGADGSLNKYENRDLSNPKALDEPDQTHDLPFHDISFCFSGDYFVTACDDGEVSLFVFPTCSSESTPIRFDTPAVSARFQPKRDSYFLAAASESGRIRLLNVLSPTSGDIVEWEGDKGGIRSLCWHPSGDLLSVAGLDGNLTVFRFEGTTQPPSSIFSSKPFPKIRPANGAQRLLMDFHPDGSQLVLPGQMDVVILSTADWAEKFCLRGQHHHPIAVTKFSSNGEYLATGDTSGKIVIWAMLSETADPPRAIAFQQLVSPESENFDVAEVMSQFTSEPSGVASIIWSAEDSMIVAGDCAGNLFEWKPTLSSQRDSVASQSGSVPATLPYSQESSQESATSRPRDTSATETREVIEQLNQATPNIRADDLDMDIDIDIDIDDADDDCTLVGSSRKIIRRRKMFVDDSDSDNEEKASQEATMGGFFSDSVVLDEANEMEDDDSPTSQPLPQDPSQKTLKKASEFDMNKSIETYLKQDDEQLNQSEVVVDDPGDGDGDVVMDDIEDAEDPIVEDDGFDPVPDSGGMGLLHQPIDDDHIRSVFLQHSPFQSGNTPFDESKQRYLAWNEIGAVIGREDATSFGKFAIEIDFCDKSLYPRSVRFRENRMFDVAALGRDSLFLGCHASDISAEGNVPVVRYHGFQTTWCGTVEWTHILSESDGICCVGVTDGYAVAATSMNYLRVFSKGGMQVAVLSLPGEPITIASSLVSDTIAVAYQTVAGLKVWVLDLEGQKRIYEGDVTLSSHALLTWMYFGPNDMLLTVDSSNIMRALTRSFDWTWTPVLDLSEGVLSHLQRDQESMNIQDIDIHNRRVIPICFDYVEGYDPALMTLVLKSGEAHPCCMKTPNLTPIPLQIPVLGVSFNGSENDESKVSFGAEEEAILRKDLMYQMGDRTNTAAMAQKFKKERIKASVVLFQRACEMNRQYLAFDIARLYLTSKKALLAAVKIASHSSLNQLAEKINGLLRKRERDRNERLEREAIENDRSSMDFTGNMPFAEPRRTPPAIAPEEREDKSNSPDVHPPESQAPQSGGQQLNPEPSNLFAFGNNSFGGNRKRNRRKRRLEEPSEEPNQKRRQTVPFAGNANPKPKKQGSSLFDL